jgi:hypothetical protein
MELDYTIGDFVARVNPTIDKYRDGPIGVCTDIKDGCIYIEGKCFGGASFYKKADIDIPYEIVNDETMQPIEKKKCDKCQINTSRHSVWNERLCCECYVNAGNAPSDWHPLCMETYLKKHSVRESCSGATAINMFKQSKNETT